MADIIGIHHVSLILYSSLAQSVEHLTVNQVVAGSSPAGGAKIHITLYAPLAQLVEQLTLNQWVQGSSPWRCTSKGYMVFSFPPLRLAPERVPRLLVLSRPFACRALSPAPARLCLLALGGLRIVKTVINCFSLLTQRGSQKKQIKRPAFFYSIRRIGM